MMVNSLIFGFLLILIAGFTQGTFAIFLKYMHPLKWENFWGLYVIVSLILGPVIVASFLIPNLFHIISLIPISFMVIPMVFGAIWGIGSLLFGISLVRIGLALTYTIVLGLVTVIGAVLPILINHTQMSVQSLTFLVLGLIIILSGTVLSGYAGVLKDGLGKLNKSFKIGILLAVISGITSSMLNVGFVSAGSIVKVAQQHGISVANTSSLIWVIILFGGFLVNIGYVLYLLIKNKTIGLYKKINLKILLAAIVAGVFWYVSFALFGFAANILGNLGSSVGWAMLISLSIVISNIWGITFGEWKGSPNALKTQIRSIGLIIIGTISIAISAIK